MTNECPKDDFKDEIKIKSLLHDLRMKEVSVDDPKENFTLEDFNDIIEKLKHKNSGKYKCLLKAGEFYKNAIFNLFKLIWQKEEKPKQFKNTVQRKG